MCGRSARLVESVRVAVDVEDLEAECVDGLRGAALILEADREVGERVGAHVDVHEAAVELVARDPLGGVRRRVGDHHVDARLVDAVVGGDLADAHLGHLRRSAAEQEVGKGREGGGEGRGEGEGEGCSVGFQGALCCVLVALTSVGAARPPRLFSVPSR